jgi:hypothetical protein
VIRLLWTFALVLIMHGTALAHELRPGFLEISQTGLETYDVRFKVPARGDMRLALYVRLPNECFEAQPGRTERTGDAILERLVVRCPGGLPGYQVSIDGLAGTFTDVVVRVALADGAVQATRLTPDQPYFTVAAAPTWMDTARTYFLLGIEHILFGFDHLLFVAGLMLIVRRWGMLVKTVTAFTVVHSITLTCATLGWVNLPSGPVEVMIAFSIALVAAEIIRMERGGTSLAISWPWIVAFFFGLLHGFGFAGALADFGLPQGDIPLALFSFNVGVELGQLMFIAVLLLAAKLVQGMFSLPKHSVAASAYAIGIVAAFWTVERLTSTFLS